MAMRQQWTEDDDEDEAVETDHADAAVESMTDAWLHAAGRYRLFSGEQELAIGRARDAGGWGSAPVCNCCPTPIEALVNHNLRLVVAVTRKFRVNATSHAIEDLWQYGVLGLMMAAQRWDWRRGFKFSTYATWWISQQVTRYMINEGYQIREPVHVVTARTAARRRGEHVDETAASLLTTSLDRRLNPDDPNSATLGELMPDRGALDLAEWAGTQELRRQLLEALTQLTERERWVLILRFGLADGDRSSNGKQPTLEQVGRELGVTRERVRQIEAQALRKLRVMLELDGAGGIRPTGRMVYYPQMPPASVAPAAGAAAAPSTRLTTTQRPAPDVPSSPPQPEGTREPSARQSRMSVSTKTKQAQARRRVLPSQAGSVVSSSVVSDAGQVPSGTPMSPSAGKCTRRRGATARGDGQSRRTA
jgi:RNA polymerase primary sigma factor